MESTLLLIRRCVQPSNFCRSVFTNACILNKTTVGVFNKSPSSKATAAEPTYNVPGLSNAVLTTNEPVGPGASKSGEYKVPEYFNYNTTSYFEAEVELAKYRTTPASALKK